MEELLRLFTLQQVDTIIREVAKPTREQLVGDKLIWKHSKTGSYSVKEGYKRLEELAPRLGNMEGEFWQRIWGWKGVAPKVKIFLWRLLSKALPVARNMHTRINRFSPMCQRCNQENEYEVHCFFFCQGSRAVWFGSVLGIQTQHLPLEIGETIKQICNGLDEEQLKVFSYTMWEIWKERNEAVIHRRTFQPKAVLARVKGWLRPIEQNIQNAGHFKQESVEGRHNFRKDSWQVLLDGSWDVSKAAGTAHLIYKGGVLEAVGVQTNNLQDSFLAEAVALQQAIRHLREEVNLQQEQEVYFFTDCAGLATAIYEKDVQNLPSWHATRVVAKIIKDLEGLGKSAAVFHITRKGVEGSHLLANQARRIPTDYRGAPDHNKWPELQKYLVLDEQFFQQVQEAPP
ncbi:Ribonuclease H-like superfamily protein [Rhynchospora pubera]|uniref:Ribonuclease H-like superfamily protein n=1 Tax=Rhynchospora pubera TaxID=906938 RepID=A0AAV8GNX9_9POAL|nr:Ribonuclease H-like superfamily protein [Rhynchospora pubera]KAJ4805305.1 Ribonuclease H-like superfamily protein [Rhynchospora pubera]